MTPTTRDPEKSALQDHLDGQRRHVLGILDGLDEGALRRPVLPSSWNCLGLVQHLALDDEQFWFQAVVTGDRAVIDRVMGEDNDAWKVGPDVSVEEVFDLYREQAERSNAIISATPLDAEPAWWPPFFPNFRMETLREVILHVLTETSVHAGHLDAARELIDNRQWMVLG